MVCIGPIEALRSLSLRAFSYIVADRIIVVNENTAETYWIPKASLKITVLNMMRIK